MTAVLLTIDTGFAWRYHAAGFDLATIRRRSIEPAGVGITYQLRRLAEHGLKACFFVDPMPAMTYGLDIIRQIMVPILSAGQDVQLALHPRWTAAKPGDRGQAKVRSDLFDYSSDEQRALIAGARELLVAAGAPEPVAFRAGHYAADDRTLEALAELGFAYDSSHNGAYAPRPCRTQFDRRQIAPVRHRLIEVPVTVVEDAPGSLQAARICALSRREMAAMLDHAVDEGHAAVTIISDGFDLAGRGGTRVNAVHKRRFDALCAMLAKRRPSLPTVHFKDRPTFPLGRRDEPLGPSRLRTRLRQAEQLWSNLMQKRDATAAVAPIVANSFRDERERSARRFLRPDNGGSPARADTGASRVGRKRTISS